MVWTFGRSTGKLEMITSGAKHVHIQVCEGLNGCTKNALMLLAWPFLPFILIGAKVVALFNPGKTGRDFASASLQQKDIGKLGFQLQLFIVFSRPDREPSTLQMIILHSFLLPSEEGG